MGFADEVQAATKGTGGNITKLVACLNQLDTKQRREIIAYLDNVPKGTQWTAVARAIQGRLDAAGIVVEPSPVNDDNVKRFVEGSRYGLEA